MFIRIVWIFKFDILYFQALRLYLSMFELDREELLEQDKTIILDFISKLKAADPNNPKVLTKAMAIYYLYGM